MSAFVRAPKAATKPETSSGHHRFGQQRLPLIHPERGQPPLGLSMTSRPLWMVEPSVTSWKITPPDLSLLCGGVQSSTSPFATAAAPSIATAWSNATENQTVTKSIGTRTPAVTSQPGRMRGRSETRRVRATIARSFSGRGPARGREGIRRGPGRGRKA